MEHYENRITRHEVKKEVDPNAVQMHKSKCADCKTIFESTNPRAKKCTNCINYGGPQNQKMSEYYND